MPQKKIEALATEQICEAFEQTNSMKGDHVPTLRGWLMDALEDRNPEAFDAWMDSEPSFADTPSHFFK